VSSDGRHPVRIGLKLRPERYAIDVQRQVWLLGDDAGFDHIWSYDHLVAVGADVNAPIFEGWSLVAAMAEGTRRARIGLLVTGNQYRHPSLLAKMATTVDHLSGGRLELGIGAGWNEPEFAMLGLPYPSTADRIRALDEACTVMKRLWTHERANYAGRYYQLRDAIAEPKPIQRPHPPIWIGGSGPRRTLRVVARHADVWNTNGKTLEEDVRSSRLLDEHCHVIGREPFTVRRSAQLFWQDVDSTCRQAAAYVAAGFTELVLVIHPDRLPPRHEPGPHRRTSRLRSAAATPHARLAPKHSRLASLLLLPLSLRQGEGVGG
jgi:F420-dependent oxidoreductase-like protein